MKNWKLRSVKDKINSRWDAIVVGSGIGGLTTAAILARRGMKVLVTEAHDRPGGCLHTFQEKGIRFSTGNHYVGVFDEDMTAVWDFITNGKARLRKNPWKTIENFEQPESSRVVVENGKHFKLPHTYTLHKGEHMFFHRLLIFYGYWFGGFIPIQTRPTTSGCVPKAKQNSSKVLGQCRKGIVQSQEMIAWR